MNTTTAHRGDASRRPIVILGAGPAGVGLAWRLAQRPEFHVTLLEKNALLGGNAGSFTWAERPLDYGSHRLHPACDAEILHDIQAMLGADLLDRPRHGRIRLRGRWLHFPLKAAEAITRMPPSFLAGIAWDGATKVLRSRRDETFADVLQHGLGATICRDFYFPYAVKIWGMEPDQLSAEQARRRVAASSLTRLVGKVLGALPGVKRPGKGRFYYPRQGFGQICEAYAQAAQRGGAEVVFNADIESLEFEAGQDVVVRGKIAGEGRTWPAAQLFSTIPLPVTARLIRPQAPAEIHAAAERLRYRAMILIYLELETSEFTEFDAHYFPEPHVRITRLSEPRHYGLLARETTVLCAELPCHVTDAVWQASDAELGERVAEDLARAGLPVKCRVRQVTSRRLPQAYPIYTRDFADHFRRLDQWVHRHAKIVSLGRQGLFAHDNTHHTLAMAYAADRCLAADGTWQAARWELERRRFEQHVVED